MHRVFSSMLVTELYNRIAGRILLCDAIKINLLVQQDHLWHSGSITDTINPITFQPTCFLSSRTVVTVRVAFPYPHYVLPEGPLLEHVGEICDSFEEPGRYGVPLASVMVEDAELEALYRELVEVKAKILSRWTALFTPLSSVFRSQRVDDTDEGLPFAGLQISSSTDDAVSPKFGTTPRKSDLHNKRTRDQEESTDKLQESTDKLISRRASSRQVVKRIPYTGGNGGGLAKKDSEAPSRRRPVNERWTYDVVPALTVQQSESETKTIEGQRDKHSTEEPTSISLLPEKGPGKLTIHGELRHGELANISALANGELQNGETTIINQSREFTYVEDLTYSFVNWISDHHRDPFTVVLEFPNTIDPDHPIITLDDRDFEVFTNQTVPNLYLQVSHLLGVFPSCMRLMVAGSILRHTGLISTGECKALNGEVVGKCPKLSHRSIVTVKMLCTDGIMVIPHGIDGLPVGFPISYPPDGMTRADAPGGMTIWQPRTYAPRNHEDAAAEQFRMEVTNVPDSDESESEELTDAEFRETIMESTCLNTVDNWGDAAVQMMISNPGFTILRYGNGTALVLFPDKRFRVFFTRDIDDACANILGTTYHGESTGNQTDESVLGSISEDELPSNPKKSIDNINALNSRERYNRRLYAAEMKAVWDFDYQLSRVAVNGNDTMEMDMAYAKYLDYITEKLRIYDEDYFARLKVYKTPTGIQTPEPELTAEDRLRNDNDSRLRQARTENLWKGLRRLLTHRFKVSQDGSSYGSESDLDSETELMLGRLMNATDKYEAAVIIQPPNEDAFSTRKIFLSTKTMRRILNFKESIMKYGIFVPRNDNEADNSPERIRWASGRQLEWMRLQVQGTFERNWDWARVQKKFPNYKKSDIGHMFFVYDFKHSGEHRVRLVFDGSRQNPDTYTETYAPTARGESVRLFHIYAVEERWEIAQYDVPQAFLKSKIDCDIFVYPPRNFAEFPNQLLKLKLSLYGAKQSAALWNNMIDQFLQELGFVPSVMDPCLYKRSDAVIILFVDDLRVAATPPVLKTIYEALFSKFQITTSDCKRFLGMDTVYDIKKGYLKLHMETYIISIYERFHSFDLSMGVPFREIVGCLMWVCLCIMGPELLRVKDLARLSNTYTAEDFSSALKVLDRVYSRRNHGIVIVRGGAGSELIPSSTRATGPVVPEVQNQLFSHTDDLGSTTNMNELREKSLYKVKEDIADEDIRPIILQINDRYNLIIYSDASFAVGDTKQSVSGFVIFLNGTPLLWGSLKQTIVVDSSCSAEYVAASVACKQAIHAENIIGFLGFSCRKPYLMYTDSTACLSIATNAQSLGNVRHLAIRFNLVRCYVTIGEITMRYCVTEEMIADLLTKIVAGDQDARLTLRFYNLCPSGSYYVTDHV